MSALPNFNPRLRATGAPVTLALIGALIATFLLAWFGLRELFGADLALLANSIRSAPWTLVTYPFANLGDGTGLLWMLLTLLWLWWAGAALEREMGSGRFAVCWITATVAGGLLASAGALIAGVQFVLLGPMLPLSAVTMMWGARNAEARIMLMMIIPFKGSWLAVFFGAFVSFSATQMFLDKKPKPTRQMPGTGGQLAAGGVIGFLSGLVGAGGGFISVPFMAWCNVAIHNAVATSAALGFPIAVANVTGYVIAGQSVQDLPAGSFGYIWLPALVVIALCSVFTAPASSARDVSLDVRRTTSVLWGTVTLRPR